MKIRTIVLLTCIIIGIVVVAGTALADVQGPAPNSGDCIPDGSGFDSFDGIGPAYGPGPAPNSHDGIPDGPGW